LSVDPARHRLTLLHLLGAPEQADCHENPPPCSAPVARSGPAVSASRPTSSSLRVRWYLRFGLSYRDVEELLAERSVQSG
jgi:hypothetical protein